MLSFTLCLFLVFSLSSVCWHKCLPVSVGYATVCKHSLVRVGDLVPHCDSGFLRREDHEKTSKRPHKATASGSRSLSGAKGLVAQGTEQVNKKGTSSQRQSVSPAVPDCKGDRIQPLLLCGMDPQFITFGLKGSLSVSGVFLRNRRSGNSRSRRASGA